MRLWAKPGLRCAALVVSTACAVAADSPQVLSQRTYHLRSGTGPEWTEFARNPVDAPRLDLRFESHSNREAATLLLAQDDVKLDWTVQLNGKRLGTLFLMEAPLVQTISVPAGVLREGENVLSIIPPQENDDILVGPIELFHQSASEALNQASLDIEVLAEDQKPLPCRLTVLDEFGRLAALGFQPGPTLAVRPGVAYTGNGHVELGIRPGRYTVYATRGFEYSLASAPIAVEHGQRFAVHLQLRREVDTRGLVACDTHLHTFTYARHGDATVEERAVTLAGEGIELPISTEHNQLVDLAHAARRAGVQDWFTPVIGEEVTTSRGHFNIFPVDPFASLPDPAVTDWPRLMQTFRTTPGVQVVVLNHPRNIHNGFQPFASTNFNASTGENRRGFEFGFDAIEVANSSALQSDWRASLRDWFALLNYGYRLTAVGSSDVHDVSRYIVGQGRTYLACADRDPSQIDVDQACKSLRTGRALVSLGLLTQLRVDGRFCSGDLATNLGHQIEAEVTVQGPSWVRAERVELYQDGVLVRSERIDAVRPGAAAPGPLHFVVSWKLPRPKHDVHWVALATGPGVTAPFWAIARPYQPSSPDWDPPVLGLSNPVWIDADGDGRFSSPRAYARQVIANYGTQLSQLLPALADDDETVAAQVASLLKADGVDLTSAVAHSAWASASPAVQRGFAAFCRAEADVRPHQEP